VLKGDAGDVLREREHARVEIPAFAELGVVNVFRQL
jgi:hypothetical protein